jgi:hypothetical protein
MDIAASIVKPILARIIAIALTGTGTAGYATRLFDLLEDIVADTETPIDDRAVLPVIRALRTALAVPARTDN